MTPEPSPAELAKGSANLSYIAEFWRMSRHVFFVASKKVKNEPRQLHA